MVENTDLFRALKGGGTNFGRCSSVINQIITAKFPSKQKLLQDLICTHTLTSRCGMHSKSTIPATTKEL